MGQCYMCTFGSDDPAIVTKHVVRHHKNNSAFRVQCQFCGVTYAKWTSFKSHLQRKHADALPIDDERDNNLHVEIPPVEIPPDGAREDDNIQPQPPGEGDVGLRDGAYENPPMEPNEGERMNADEIHRWEPAKFLLNIREKGNMTQTAVQLVIEGVDNIVKSRLTQTHAKLLDARGTPDSPSLPVGVVNNIMQEAMEVSTFDGINTKYLLDQFWEQRGVISPKELHLGECPFLTKTNPPRIGYRQCKAYYVPLKEALHQMLSHPELLSYVENPVVRNDDVIRDLRDGTWYKNHPLFSVDPRALQILFYHDDLQTSNVAGARPQKFSMFYWVLGNIPAHLRSSLRAINVFAIAKSSYVRRFGIDVILRAFVADIKELQDGLTFTINGTRKTFRGSLYFVSADTPAAQLLAGFKEGVGNALCPCRRCKATRDSLQGSFREDDFQLRDKESHEVHVSQVEDQTLSAEARAQLSKQHGVSRRSEFCQLDDFDVTQNVVHDAMHVFMEGVLPLEIKLLLRYVVNEKRLVSLKALNHIISSFDSGHMKVDHPGSIESAHLDNKLRQISMQMLALGHILPFALKSKIETDSGAIERLNNLLRLMQIIDFALSFEFTLDDVALLEHMVQIHLSTYRMLYPDVNLVPKHHYMVHFPRQIVQFGPLRYQWCVRYEAAHAYFKRLMQIVLCYKNPPE